MIGKTSALLSCVVVATLLLTFNTVRGDDSTGSDSESTPAAATESSGVQFEDDFSYAAGASQTQVDGEEPTVDGELHCSMFSYARVPSDTPTHLKLVMTEDHTVDGPDGQPGVLRMEIAEVPLSGGVSGFVIEGNETFSQIAMSGWKRGDVTMNDLRRAFVTFRFRADNREDPNAIGATFNLKFEPDLERTGDFAAECGALIATRRWRTFRRPLASAENLEEFLAAVNGENPERFLLVWSQADHISSYVPGDALLIDDLQVSIE